MDDFRFSKVFLLHHNDGRVVIKGFVLSNHVCLGTEPRSAQSYWASQR